MNARIILTILCALVLVSGVALLATSPAAHAQACPNHRCPN
ncbi:MAG: hypothetical protein ACHQPH_09060 [Reyranellales bacterium]